MPERTYPSQQDEALRRSRANDTDAITEGRRWIADRLTKRFPADLVDPASLRWITRGWAVQVHNWSAEADKLTRRITETLPTPRAGETRGEYAIRIRPTGGAR